MQNNHERPLLMNVVIPHNMGNSIFFCVKGVYWTFAMVYVLSYEPYR